MLSMQARGLIALAASLLPIVAAGCGGGDELPREAVSGTVTLDGQPLPKGSIQFTPSDPELGTAGSAQIEGGSYSIPTAAGLVPGHYVVRIYAAVEANAPTDEAPGEPGPPPKEPIPAKYNANTTLGAEVVAGQDNAFSFDLQSR